MAIAALPNLAIEAVTTIENVGSQIERVFAEVGGHLGGAHTIFAELNSGLGNLSGELSGSKIEGASAAFQDIATRLRGLAEALPAETALLGNIAAGTTQASTLLKQLIKQVHLITVIARSSRIEAASLEGNRTDFLSFTQEASDLAITVERSIAACSKEQEQLAGAIAMALNGQLEFERRYREQLLSVSAELISAFSEIKHLQTQGADLAELAKASTAQISDAVGGAIVSLQAGDSTRQRLEHICRGLRMVADGDGRQVEADPFICLLQAAQLEDAVSGFETDIGNINRSLVQLSDDSSGIVRHGQSLYGGKNDNMSSFLAVTKQRLAQASALISASGQARLSVDASIATLESMLVKFRVAISVLDEAIIDITLIGMNAGLKAGHLGVKGRAFVVIANELKQTADHIAGAAKTLVPILTEIGRAADRLKSLRSDEESLRVSELEQSISGAVEEIERGNGRLVQLMEHLTRESAQFETLMTVAKKVMSDLGAKIAVLPTTAGLLEQASGVPATLAPHDAAAVGELFDEMYRQYTMHTERDLHRGLSDRYGIVCAPPSGGLEMPGTDAEDVLFF